MVVIDPRQAKGLEFDTVLVVEPAEFGASDLYVALTRATQRLGVLHTEPLPAALSELAEPTGLSAPADPADLSEVSALTAPEAGATGR